MIRRLYEGVDGIQELTNEIRLASASASLIPDPSSLFPASDKLREECGVVAIHGHPDAAREAYLGLYALQHRG